MDAIQIPIQHLTKLGKFVVSHNDRQIIDWASDRLLSIVGADFIGNRLESLAVVSDRRTVQLALRTKSGVPLALRGVWIPADPRASRVFVGSPIPESPDEIKQLGLGLSDFVDWDCWLSFQIASDEAAATQKDAWERIELLRQERERASRTRDEMIDARLATVNMMLDLEQSRGETEQAHERLVDASRKAGQAEVAVGVLHNVGNVLNSVNTSAATVRNGIQHMRLDRLAKVSELFERNSDDLGRFITEDEKGMRIPEYLETLHDCLQDEQQQMISELASLVENVEYISEIVTMQQSMAKPCLLKVEVRLEKQIDAALSMEQDLLQKNDIEVVREYGELPMVLLDKHKVMQILINLVSNAKHAMIARTDGVRRRLIVRLERLGPDRALIEIADNGVGISTDNLNRMFDYGFSTRSDGHGFGLHTCANAAAEMNGTLTANSRGHNHGATFTFELPFEPVEAIA